jgi:hypothetical protein
MQDIPEQHFKSNDLDESIMLREKGMGTSRRYFPESFRVGRLR